MASPNHLPRHRLCLLYWFRQQLRPDWRRDRSANVQKQICTSLHGALLRGHGPGRPLRDPDAGDMVDNMGDGARHQTVEVGENRGGKERRDYSGGSCGQRLEKALEKELQAEIETHPCIQALAHIDLKPNRWIPVLSFPKLQSQEK